MQEAQREKLNPCQLEVVRMTRHAKIIQRPKAVQTNGISYTTIERGGRRELPHRHNHLRRRRHHALEPRTLTYFEKSICKNENHRLAVISAINSEIVDFAGFGFLQILEDNKKARDKDDGQAGGGEHAAGHGESEASAGTCASAAGKEEGEDAENKGEGGHDDWAKARAGGLNRRVLNGCACGVAFPGHFHDEDRIFGGKGDEEDEADLDVDIVRNTGEFEGQNCPKDGQRDG